MKYSFLLFICCAFQQIGFSLDTTPNPKRILFVLSNAHYHGQSDIHTANHFYEIVLPYDEFVKAGYEVDFVSPEGGQVPIGYLNYSYETAEDYLYNCDFMAKLKNTLTPQQVKASDYASIFYSGGGAAMYGVPEDATIQKIAIQIYEQQQGVVGAICHGTAGIVHLKTKDGQYLVAGKKVNGFPDIFENKKADYYQQFPFSIQQIITERGGNFQYSKEGWDEFMQTDGRLITAQDPTGSRKVAKKIIATLAQQNQ